MKTSDEIFESIGYKEFYTSNKDESISYIKEYKKGAMIIFINRIFGTVNKVEISENGQQKDFFNFDYEEIEAIDKKLKEIGDLK